MTEHARLLSEPTNFAIVQLPGRKFPGVVVQGDTMFTLVQQLDEMIRLLDSANIEDLAFEIGDMRETLFGVLKWYEDVCASNGITLPYSK